MNQKISGPVAIAVIVVAALILCGGLYMRYFHETKSTPEQMKASMEKHMAERYNRNKRQAVPSASGTPSATPSGQ